MTYITNEIINIFGFLLPGFITSFLFYSLMAFPKKSEFESVIMALIYTVVINSIVEALSWVLPEWSPNIKVLWSVFLALLFGFLLAFLYNNDLFHKLLRKLKITNQTSYPTEWYGTFSETPIPSYIVLHLTDGRRIMGLLFEWPSSPEKGHFVLYDASWLDENNKEIKLSDVEKIMLDTINVSMVEFIKSKEVKDES